MTLAQIADLLDAEADGLAALGHPVASASAVRLRLVATELRRLSPGTQSGTLAGVTPAQAQYARRLAEERKTGGLHPLQTWLYDAERADDGPRSLTELARAVGATPEQVRSWCRESQARRVPVAVAQLIQDRWGLPATPATWPNGIR